MSLTYTFQDITSKCKFTYTITWNNSIISTIDNSDVLDKTGLIIPSNINSTPISSITITLNVSNITAKGLTSVKTLTIPSGLTISPGAFVECAFANVMITKGTTTTIGNYQALSIADNCNLTISSGITNINTRAFQKWWKLVPDLDKKSGRIC